MLGLAPFHELTRFLFSRTVYLANIGPQDHTYSICSLNSSTRRTKVQTKLHILAHANFNGALFTSQFSSKRTSAAFSDWINKQLATRRKNGNAIRFGARRKRANYLGKETLIVALWYSHTCNYRGRDCLDCYFCGLKNNSFYSHQRRNIEEIFLLLCKMPLRFNAVATAICTLLHAIRFVILKNTSASNFILWRTNNGNSPNPITNIISV